MAKERILTALDKMVLRAIGREDSLGPEADVAAESFPLLVAWLTRVDAGRDHVKDPARLTIRAVPGGYCVSLADATFGIGLDAGSSTLQGVFAALEAALGSETPALKTFGKMRGVRKRKST